MREVTDPSLLEKLNAPQLREVTDPAILKQLNGDNSPAPWSFENFANSGAKGMTKTALGIAQTGVEAANALGMMDPSRATSLASKFGNAAQDESLQKDFPTSNGFVHGLGEYVLGNPFNALAGIGKIPTLANTMGGAALSSGVPAFLSPRQDEGGVEKRAINSVQQGALGAGVAAGGYGVLSGIGRVLQPVKNSLSEEGRALVAALKKENIPLTAAQETGSASLHGLEAAFGGLPGTTGTEQALRGAQSNAFTKAVLKKIGIEGESASPEVVEQAYKDIGGKIGSITKGASIKSDDVFMNDVMNVMDEYGKIIDPLKRPQFDEYVSAITEKPEISGEMYQRTRSQFGKIMKSAWNSDPNYGKAIEGLQDALDEAMQRNLPAQTAKELSEARNQYGNLKVITKALGGASTDALEGQIPPGALRSALRTANPLAYAKGTQDLNDLARGGSLILKDNIPNSGTPQRMSWQQLLQGGAPSGVGATVGAMFGGTPGAAMGAIAGAVAPKGVQSIYYSSPMQKYLKEGVMKDPISPEQKKALAILLSRQIVGGLNNPTTYGTATPQVPSQ